MQFMPLLKLSNFNKMVNCLLNNLKELEIN